ncbi:MAG: AtpZ/AtpI family protein [Pseudomonadota bacterium]
MSEDEPEVTESERLRRLEAKIAAAKGETPTRAHNEEHYSQAQLAWRMVTELVAGLGIGLLIGLGLDTLFGTAPILMVVFIGFGLAAGIRVMMRTAGEVNKRAPGGRAEDDDGPGGTDEGKG